MEANQSLTLSQKLQTSQTVSISLDAGLQIVAFDTYDETPSLKDKTRISRKKLATPPRDFNVNLENRY